MLLIYLEVCQQVLHSVVYLIFSLKFLNRQAAFHDGKTDLKALGMVEPKVVTLDSESCSLSVFWRIAG